MVASSKFVSQGLPLILLTVGGWVSLSYFLKHRIDVQEAQRTYVDQYSPVQKQKAKSFDLKQELERLEASNRQNRNDYENKPLPRPT